MNLLEDTRNPLWEKENVIYVYVNKINGKKYVGQTSRKLKKRHWQHIHSAKCENRKEYHQHFHRSLRKNGMENFELYIVHYGKTREELDYFEIFFIKYFNSLSLNHGYNISSGGSGGNSFAGKNEEEMIEIRKKLSKNHKGKKQTEASRKKMSESHKGKKLSEETKRKIGEAHKGKEHSEKTRKKLSESHKGKKLSDKTIEKMIENRKGYKHTEETRKKMSESSKGKKMSEESRKKMSENRKKKVAQYDTNGNLIKIWNSIKEAGEQLNINISNISRVCLKKRKTAGGFIWKYYEEE